MKTSRVEAKGTNMVVHQVGRRRKKQAVYKEACYDRVVKPTRVQYSTGGLRG
jgi:hypothetical protein